MTRISPEHPQRIGRRRVGRPRSTAGSQHAHRDRIVGTAAVLFAEQGFGKTTTSEIAQAAGSSEGTLFHHFPTKRALLAEVGRREGERVFEVAFAGVDPAAPPPEPEALVQSLFDYARKEPAAYRLFAMDGDLEDLEAGFSAKRDSLLAGITAILAGWSARGFLRQMNPDIVAELIFAIVDGAVRRLVLEDRWNEQEVWLRETCRAIEALLAPGADEAQRRTPTRAEQ